MLLDIQDAVLSKYPTATIRPFGSHSVGLATFMSDIDISIDNIPLDTDMLANNNADKSASQSITGSTGSSVMRSVDKEVPGLLRLHQSFSQPAVDRNTPPPPPSSSSSSSSSITRSTAIKNSHDKSALGLGTGDRVDNRVTWSIDRAPDKVVAVNSPHSIISHTKVAADDDADGRDADAVTGDGRYEKKAKANDECTDHTLDGIQMVYDLSYDDDDDDRCIIDYDESTGTSDNSDHEEYNPSKKHKPLSMKTPQQQQQQPQLSTDIDVIFLDCEDQLQNAATTQQSSSDVITLDDDVMQSLNSGMRRARRYGSRRLSGASDNSGTDDGQRRTSKVKVLQRLYSLIQVRRMMVMMMMMMMC